MGAKSSRSFSTASDSVSPVPDSSAEIVSGCRLRVSEKRAMSAGVEAVRKRGRTSQPAHLRAFTCSSALARFKRLRASIAIATFLWPWSLRPRATSFKKSTGRLSTQ